MSHEKITSVFGVVSSVADKSRFVYFEVVNASFTSIINHVISPKLEHNCTAISAAIRITLLIKLGRFTRGKHVWAGNDASVVYEIIHRTVCNISYKYRTDNWYTRSEQP